MKRPTLEQARARYVHRYTCEHVPAWATAVRPCGTYYAPQFRDDAEWYANTLFGDESPFASPKWCYTSNQSWPHGQSLDHPFRRV